MKLKELIKNGENVLQEAGIADYKMDAWLLAEFVLKIDRNYYFLNQNEDADIEKEIQYFEFIKKRMTHIPLQHITGVQEFMGYQFIVNENVLIPRQDTEVLIEEVLKNLTENMKILDVCTGSGCIIISLYMMMKEKNKKIHAAALDISKKALETARNNAIKLAAEVTFFESDIFENISDKFDIIVSNPPYIKTKVIDELMEEVKEHEPIIALDGMEDGLYFYRKITKQSVNYIKDDGMLFYEIGYDQAADVSNIMKENGYTDIKLIKDLSGLDRVIWGRYR